VTWNDPIEIENYIKQVQARATDLIAENRKLRKVHISVTDMVIELMNIDLLKNRSIWKENLGKMRRIIETVTKSRTAEMSKLWLTHLNYQLYKALEFQYQMGLESLNESLPEISADLVYRNQTIEFRPTFEELKSKYYTEISSFITIPLKFVGVGDTAVF
jgi:dynein heavy chain 2